MVALAGEGEEVISSYVIATKEKDVYAIESCSGFFLLPETRSN